MVNKYVTVQRAAVLSRAATFLNASLHYLSAKEIGAIHARCVNGPQREPFRREALTSSVDVGAAY